MSQVNDITRSDAPTMADAWEDIPPYSPYPSVTVKFVEKTMALLPEDKRREIEANYLTEATLGSAAIDLRYIGEHPLTVKPGEVVVVPTGLAIWLKDITLVGKIYPRSGLGTKGLVLGNLTGVVDSDYQQEIKLALWNRNPIGGETFSIESTERVAQLIIIKREIVEFKIVDSFSEDTGRSAFGSTGRF